MHRSCVCPLGLAGVLYAAVMQGTNDATGKPHYIVVRVSNMDDRDVVGELDAVIAERGFAWFGKYGRPMGAPILTRKDPSILVLVSGSSRRTGHICKPYSIGGFSLTIPQDRTFPEYYLQFIRRIRTWVKVQRTSEEVAVSDLIVASSASPLSETLNQSMSSHFICLRKDKMRG